MPHHDAPTHHAA